MHKLANTQWRVLGFIGLQNFVTAPQPDTELMGSRNSFDRNQAPIDICGNYDIAVNVGSERATDLSRPESINPRSSIKQKPQYYRVRVPLISNGTVDLGTFEHSFFITTPRETKISET